MNAVVDLPSVIAAGQTSRAEMAGELAHAFLQNPAHFDPTCLERLGATGLCQFLRHVGVDSAMSVPNGSIRPTTAARQANPAITTRVSGWSHLRRREQPVWVVGVAVGIRVGVFTVGAGLVAMFCVEHLLPLATGLLS